MLYRPLSHWRALSFHPAFDPALSLWHKKIVPSSWLQLSVQAHPSSLDAVSNFLIERGSPGVVIKKNEIQAYFAYSPEAMSIKRDVQRFLQGIDGIYPNGGERRLRWRVLKDRNWNKSWRRFFSPQRVGKAFWVTPPWARPPQFRRRKVITIEPGMAFGTGTHASTRGCLEFFEEIAPSFNGSGFKALDVGTGSGILAIALVKLGARKVVALDIDPVALRAARTNVRRNGTQNRVVLSRSKVSYIRTAFPVVVANLTAETIIQLARTLEKKVSRRGFLVLSGILKPKVREVLSHFSSDRFLLAGRRGEKEWTTLLLRRK